MKLEFLNDDDKACEWASQYIKQKINEFNPSAEKLFVIALPTGRTPLGVYKKLVEFHNGKELSFKYVQTFNIDEYVGLPRNHPQSYHSYMFNNFFKFIDINPINVHILNGNAIDLISECNQFEEKIKTAGGIDLFFSSIGTNSHIGFNEPGSSLTSRTRVKILSVETRLSNSQFFNNDISLVPDRALTMGVGTIMEAREVMILVTGSHKAISLQRVIEEGINHMWTASALQQHPNVVFVCDEEATAELNVKTVKYFKS